MNKIRVLVINQQYLPGYKGGGPIQSCRNMIENLYESCDFSVICADHDNKDDTVYEGVQIDGWNTVGHARVYYVSREKEGLQSLCDLINQCTYDVVYLNNFFSPIYTIKILLGRKLGKISNRDALWILSPRGDFTGGLENKKVKKYGYIAAAKVLGLYNHILWHATSDIEKKDILRLFPKAKTYTVPNLPQIYEPNSRHAQKKAGSISLVFISRIFPKKNITYALNVLKKVHDVQVTYDIYGPMEDREYWAECTKIIKELPDNISVNYCGELKHDKVGETYRKYNAFFFPTLGENYGHVIVEAMMNNCICILSRGVTPWDEYIDLLGTGAPLDDPDQFASIITRLAAMDEPAYSKLIEQNNRFIKEHNDCEGDKARYIEMFQMNS